MSSRGWLPLAIGSAAVGFVALVARARSAARSESRSEQDHASESKEIEPPATPDTVTNTAPSDPLPSTPTPERAVTPSLALVAAVTPSRWTIPTTPQEVINTMTEAGRVVIVPVEAFSATLSPPQIAAIIMLCNAIIALALMQHLFPVLASMHAFTSVAPVGWTALGVGAAAVAARRGGAAALGDGPVDGAGTADTADDDPNGSAAEAAPRSLDFTSAAMPQVPTVRVGDEVPGATGNSARNVIDTARISTEGTASTTLSPIRVPITAPARGGIGGSSSDDDTTAFFSPVDDGGALASPSRTLPALRPLRRTLDLVEPLTSPMSLEAVSEASPLLLPTPHEALPDGVHAQRDDVRTNEAERMTGGTLSSVMQQLLYVADALHARGGLDAITGADSLLAGAATVLEHLQVADGTYAVTAAAAAEIAALAASAARQYAQPVERAAHNETAAPAAVRAVQWTPSRALAAVLWRRGRAAAVLSAMQSAPAVAAAGLLLAKRSLQLYEAEAEAHKWIGACFM